MNPQTLTPPWLNFRVIMLTPIEMAVGTRIGYRLKIHMFPIRWQSLITAWDPPYRQWVHEHTFNHTKAKHRRSTTWIMPFPAADWSKGGLSRRTSNASLPAVEGNRSRCWAAVNLSRRACR